MEESMLKWKSMKSTPVNCMTWHSSGTTSGEKMKIYHDHTVFPRGEQLNFPPGRVAEMFFFHGKKTLTDDRLAIAFLDVTIEYDVYVEIVQRLTRLMETELAAGDSNLFSFLWLGMDDKAFNSFETALNPLVTAYLKAQRSVFWRRDDR